MPCQLNALPVECHTMAQAYLADGKVEAAVYFPGALQFK
jgi:hypothetical protein